MLAAFVGEIQLIFGEKSKRLGHSHFIYLDNYIYLYSFTTYEL